MTLALAWSQISPATNPDPSHNVGGAQICLDPARDQIARRTRDLSHVAADLADPHCPQRRLFLTIEGLEPILWEYHSSGIPVDPLYSRSGHSCLRPPADMVSGGKLDPREMKLSPGGVNFELEDWIDPGDGKWFLAKLFAPGAVLSAQSAHLAERDPSDWATHALLATATTIPIKGGEIGDLPASGAAFMGQEALTYAGKFVADLSTLTGAVRGLFPTYGPVGSWALAMSRPRATDAYPTVGTVPFSWIGRRVALHVVTQNLDDPTQWRWPAYLLYSGDITEGIVYDPSASCWQISTRDLREAKLNEPHSITAFCSLAGINLRGDEGLQFFIREIDAGGNQKCYAEPMTIAAGYWLSGALFSQAVADWLNDVSHWTANPSQSGCWYSVGADGSLIANNGHSDARTIQILPFAQRSGTWADRNKPCHVWQAQGMALSANMVGADVHKAFVYFTTLVGTINPGDVVTQDVTGATGRVIIVYAAEVWLRDCVGAFAVAHDVKKDAENYFSVVTLAENATAGAAWYNEPGLYSVTVPARDSASVTGQPPYAGYHPLAWNYNGGALYAQLPEADRAGGDPTGFWADQGDNGPNNSPIAHALVDGAQPYGAYGDPLYPLRPGGAQGWTISYKNIAQDAELDRFDLYDPQLFSASTFGFVSFGASDTPSKISQIWSPTWRGGKDGNGWLDPPRGPLEMLLYPLLSTGTPNYNDPTYDKLPLELSVGIPAYLVDVAGWLALDAALLAAYPDLATRREYIISGDWNWMDLFVREAQAFGIVLVWDVAAQKLKCKRIWSDVSSEEYAAMVQINEGSRYSSTHCPAAKQLSESVVNRWQVKVGHDVTTGAEVYNLDIVDSDSVVGLRDARAISLEHPGVWCASATQVEVTDWLVSAMTGLTKKTIPWWTVEEQLAPHMFTRVSVGDRVRYSNPELPDPFGSGALECAAIALVIDRRANLSTFCSDVTLLLYAPDAPPES